MSEALLIGAVSAVITLMLQHWMQYGHVLGFVPYQLSEPTPEREYIRTIKDFGERAQAMLDYYWSVADQSVILRILICPLCFSVYVYLAAFFFFIDHTALNFFLGLGGSYIVIRYAG